MTTMDVPEGLAARVADWRPGPVDSTYEVAAGPPAAFAALLDQPAPDLRTGAATPPLWHLLHAPDQPATHELGEDGHPREGGFLPPLPQRRRLFAGGRAVFHAPLRIGETVSRRTELVSHRTTTGRSGEVLLVSVRSTHEVDGAVRVVDVQDLAYRSGPARPPDGTAPVAALPVGPTARPAPPAPWTVTLDPDPVLLFRFSALTYNAHRIHYDRPYATDVEGLPGLLVHGPLLALLLLELPRRFAPERRVRTFSYRLHRPTTSGGPVVATTADGIRLAAGPAASEPTVTGSVDLV